jgi:hypothetical protein
MHLSRTIAQAKLNPSSTYFVDSAFCGFDG